MIEVRKVLYPTDFSSFSTQAYFHAVAVAENRGASLTIAHVFTPKHSPDDEHNRESLRGQLEQIRPINPEIVVDHVLLEGDPATEITQYAAEAGIDLIVMGTHGRGFQGPTLMGSVAENVMRAAPCSVLVVKMPQNPGNTDRPALAGTIDEG